MKKSNYNFSSQAIYDLATIVLKTKKKKKATPLETEMVSSIEGLTGCLIESKKYIMPPGGVVFGPNVDRFEFTELTKLPYPEIALEYVIDGEHHITLAADLDNSGLEYNSSTFIAAEAGVETIDDDPIPEHSILVVSLYKSPDGYWKIYPIGLLLYTDIHPMKCSFITLFAFREWNMKQLKEKAYLYLGVDVAVVIDLCCMVHSQKINFDRIIPSHKLQKKRQKQAKPPLFEYTVVPAISQAQPNGESQGTHHASPRFHLRRGHFRHLGKGRITWVRNTTVGDPNKGTLLHEYDGTKKL